MAQTTERVYTESDYTDTAHTGPGTLAGHYMRRFWHPIYRSVDLPNGRAIPVTHLSEQFTLYRGETGKPHLVDFRCAHRGTQLSAGWVEDDCIRCFYHGWKYDGSGQCVEQLTEDESFTARIRLKSYPIQEHLGMIFVYIGEGDPPPMPLYPDFDDPSLFTVYVYDRDCNYMNTMENLSDPLHTPFVHGTRWRGPGRGHWTRENMPKFLPCQETEWGYTDSWQEPDGTVYVNAYGMPNVRAQIQPASSASLMWKVPIDDENHRSFRLSPTGSEKGVQDKDGHMFNGGSMWEAASARDAELADLVLSGKLTVAQMEALSHQPGEFGTSVLQDSVAQVGQGRIWSRENEHLGRSDIGIVWRRMYWERELRALAEGQPMHEWVRPERFYRWNLDD